MTAPVTVETLTDALIWQVVCNAVDGQNKVLLGYCALAFGQHPGGGAANARKVILRAINAAINARREAKP